MNTHFIFDTETSGFVSNSHAPNHPNQGRLMQIACLLLDDKLDEIASYYSLVEQEEQTIIHEEAFRHHEISKEDCHKYGVPLQVALINVDALSCKSTHQVAHNMLFDARVIANEESVTFGKPILQFKNPLCTMLLTTEICKLPNVKVPSKYKWPKLEEAYKHLFGIDLQDTHDALADVRACARIYKWLVQEGFIQQIETSQD